MDDLREARYYRSMKRCEETAKGAKGVKGVITGTELMLAGAIAKAGAILATYPHEVVRTRMREQATNGVFKYNGFMQTLNMIAKEEGAKGLYGGMWIHLGRSVPNAAIMFTSFELISHYLDKQGELISPAHPQRHRQSRVRLDKKKKRDVVFLSSYAYASSRVILV